MKSLCIFLLENWYADLRKSVPANVSKRINAGIRSFERSSNEVCEAVKSAKKSGAAIDARRRRKDVSSALKHGHRFGSSIKHIPCKHDK